MTDEAWGYDSLDGNTIRPGGSMSNSAYDVSGGLGGSSAYAQQSLEERLENITKREQRAIDLQQDLDEREKRLLKIQTQSNYRPPKNWPVPWLGWARNAISNDIPEEHQLDVRKFYALWLLTAVGACLNLLILFWYGFSDDGSKDSDLDIMQWLLGFCYCIIGLPGAWMMWYKRYYRAMQLNQPIPTLFFICLFLHIAWAGIMALGFVITCSFGFLAMGKSFTDGNDSVATCMALNAAVWTGVGVMGFLTMRIAHRSLGKYYAQQYLSESIQGTG